MRVTIIRNSGLVAVDGESIMGLNLDQLELNIHAIQWYGEDGEIERADDRGRIIANEEITSFEPYKWVLDAWQSAKESMMPLPEEPSTDANL